MMGIVDFAYRDDMDYAIRKLDDTEFERGIYVRVREDRGGASPRNRSPLDPCSRVPAVPPPIFGGVLRLPTELSTQGNGQTSRHKLNTKH